MFIHSLTIRRRPREHSDHTAHSRFEVLPNNSGTKEHVSVVNKEVAVFVHKLSSIFTQKVHGTKDLQPNIAGYYYVDPQENKGLDSNTSLWHTDPHGKGGRDVFWPLHHALYPSHVKKVLLLAIIYHWTRLVPKLATLYLLYLQGTQPCQKWSSERGTLVVPSLCSAHLALKVADLSERADLGSSLPHSPVFLSHPRTRRLDFLESGRIETLECHKQDVLVPFLELNDASEMVDTVPLLSIKAKRMSLVSNIQTKFEQLKDLSCKEETVCREMCYDSSFERRFVHVSRQQSPFCTWIFDSDLPSQKKAQLYDKSCHRKAELISKHDAKFTETALVQENNISGMNSQHAHCMKLKICNARGLSPCFSAVTAAEQELLTPPRTCMVKIVEFHHHKLPPAGMVNTVKLHHNQLVWWRQLSCTTTSQCGKNGGEDCCEPCIWTSDFWRVRLDQSNWHKLLAQTWIFSRSTSNWTCVNEIRKLWCTQAVFMQSGTCFDLSRLFASVFCFPLLAFSDILQLTRAPQKRKLNCDCSLTFERHCVKLSEARGSSSLCDLSSCGQDAKFAREKRKEKMECVHLSPVEEGSDYEKWVSIGSFATFQSQFGSRSDHESLFAIPIQVTMVSFSLRVLFLRVFLAAKWILISCFENPNNIVLHMYTPHAEMFLPFVRVLAALHSCISTKHCPFENVFDGHDHHNKDFGSFFRAVTTRGVFTCAMFQTLSPLTVANMRQKLATWNNPVLSAYINFVIQPTVAAPQRATRVRVVPDFFETKAGTQQTWREGCLQSGARRWHKAEILLGYECNIAVRSSQLVQRMCCPLLMKGTCAPWFDFLCVNFRRQPFGRTSKQGWRKQDQKSYSSWLTSVIFCWLENRRSPLRRISNSTYQSCTNKFSGKLGILKMLDNMFRLKVQGFINRKWHCVCSVCWSTDMGGWFGTISDLANSFVLLRVQTDLVTLPLNMQSATFDWYSYLWVTLVMGQKGTESALLSEQLIELRDIMLN